MSARLKVGAVRLGEGLSWASWRGAKVLHIDRARYGVLCGNAPAIGRIFRLAAPLRSEWICKTCYTVAAKLPAPGRAELVEEAAS